MIKTMLVVTALIVLTGCQSLPRFQGPGASDPIGPRVSDMIDEVQCEILRALDKSEKAGEEQGALQGLLNGQYVASVNLTLDVTNNESINPSLSYIWPHHTAGTNFMMSIGGQISAQQHRNINVTFTLLFDENTPHDGKVLTTCTSSKNRSGLKGDLGIEEILASGLKYFVDRSSGAERPYKIPAIGVNVVTSSNPLTGQSGLAPSLGATIDFTVVYGIDGGPNWTLTHATGPSPQSGGLANLMRTNKNTLVLAFARVTPTAPSASKQQQDDARMAAGKAAQDNVTRMILQHLLPQ